MTSHFHSRALLPLACLLAACTNETVSEDREYSYQIEEVKVVERNPLEPDPTQPPELEYQWLQAFDRADIGDEVDLALGEDLLAPSFEARLEDLYVELWHDGAKGARRLLDGLRNCDRDAAIRFGPAVFVQATELVPQSEWPLELRYVEGDPHGRQAAELLRDHLRSTCYGDARERVREIVDRHGLVLRPVPELDHVEDPGGRIPLVLVLSPALALADGSDL